MHVKLSKTKMIGNPNIKKSVFEYKIFVILKTAVNLKSPNMRTSKQPANTLYKVIDQKFLALLENIGFIKTSRIIIKKISMTNHIGFEKYKKE